MKVTIIRGKNKIGGNIIEISTERTKILLDAGFEIDGENELPDMHGLFEYAGYDAIFISHYHADHLGLVYHAHKDIPVYMGNDCFNIISASDSYKKQKKITPKDYLRHRQRIVVGDITITPFLCDHSAFDSYMILCESGEERILYTGDFRSNGRKSFDELINSLPTKVDKLICEGTTLSRDGYIPQTEAELEEKAAKLFSAASGPVFVLQSSTNIDRLVTMYRAAKKTRRVFLEDTYLAEIATAAGEHIPNPKFRDVYAFLIYPSKYEFLKKHERKVGKDRLSKMNFVMCVRTSMLSYLAALSKHMSFENGILVYSLWSGYRETDSMRLFLSECEKMGLRIETLHTSGHADESTILKLIEWVKPTVLIPVHTENAARFREIASGVTIEE